MLHIDNIAVVAAEKALLRKAVLKLFHGAGIAALFSIFHVKHNFVLEGFYVQNILQNTTSVCPLYCIIILGRLSISMRFIAS